MFYIPHCIKSEGPVFVLFLFANSKFDQVIKLIITKKTKM